VLSNELRPIDLFINHWPSMQLKTEEEKKFLNGQTIETKLFEKRNENEYLVRVYGFSNDFIGTGQIIENKFLRPKRLISQ
jgi:tRNA U55 pseudouridine synthase TruB